MAAVVMTEVTGLRLPAIGSILLDSHRDPGFGGRQSVGVHGNRENSVSSAFPLNVSGISADLFGEEAAVERAMCTSGARARVAFRPVEAGRCGIDGWRISTSSRAPLSCRYPRRAGRGQPRWRR